MEPFVVEPAVSGTVILAPDVLHMAVAAYLARFKGQSRVHAESDLPVVLAMAEGKELHDLLFTTDRGAQLHRTATLRAVDWHRTSRGRRIHDLRHTAACLWLSRGVDPGTVQAWMGHESIATTNLYLHFLGTGAHRAGLELLNLPRGAAGGPSRDLIGE